jgi:hypothetical protein
MRGLWGNFWLRSLMTLFYAVVVCVGITAVYQTVIMLTDVFRVPISGAVVFQFAGEAFAGFLPIWGFAEWRTKRIKAIPSKGMYFTFIPVFVVVYRVAETCLARYWIAHFYAKTLPYYLPLLAWLIASFIAAVVVAIFFRQPNSAPKPQDHF